MQSKILMTIYNTMVVVYTTLFAIAFVSVTVIVFIKETFEKLKNKYERFRRRRLQ